MYVKKELNENLPLKEFIKNRLKMLLSEIKFNNKLYSS